MSDDTNATRRISVTDIKARKGGRPLACLTAYSKPMAQWLDPHMDLLLVGDSLAMVIYGLETTRGVSLDAMINHGAAVIRGSERACVIVDLPHGTYEESPELALASSKRVMAETGAQGIKLEGGVEMAETIRLLTENNIPVLGHIGLLPQTGAVLKSRARTTKAGSRSSKTPRPSMKPAPLPSSSKAPSRHWPVKSPNPLPCRPSASARRRPVMGRFWSPRIRSACFPTSPRNSSNAMPNWVASSRPPPRPTPKTSTRGVSRNWFIASACPRTRATSRHP